MSPEAQAPQPSTPEATNEAGYVNAVQKQQIEAGILNGGETFDQAHVDTLLSQVALEATPAPAIEVTQAGSDLLADLTTDPSEVDSEAAINEAARRQLDLANLDKKRELENLALKNDWTEDKYQEELQKIDIK